MLTSKGNIEVLSRLEKLRAASSGDTVKILPNMWLLKSGPDQGAYNNAYAIRHKNRRDILLIDAVRPEHKSEIARFRESGYNIKAILLTNGHMIDHAYADLSDISEELDTQIYIHPLDSKQTNTIDINGYQEVFTAFDLSIFHTPGYTSGSVVIYCGINGVLLTGASAVGSAYDSDTYAFYRPVITNNDNDIALRESWRSVSVRFEHLLPLSGKPQFDITEEQYLQIMNQLIQITPTKNN